MIVYFMLNFHAPLEIHQDFIYVTGLAKTLHISVQFLRIFRTSNFHNFLRVSSNVTKIPILVAK